jgi:hypothetical protein
VGDEAVPPAYIDTAKIITDTIHQYCTPHHKFTTRCPLLDLQF